LDQVGEGTFVPAAGGGKGLFVGHRGLEVDGRHLELRPERRRESIVGFWRLGASLLADPIAKERSEMSGSKIELPPVVSAPEWNEAHEKLQVKEKELTRARDALAAERRRMPRLAVTKDYRFEGPEGEVGLADLFEGRRQLIVYRYFYEPGVYGWPESGCRGYSLRADQVSNLAHLDARDTTLAYTSPAPPDKLHTPND